MEAAGHAPKLTVTVAICTRNRPENLAICLDHLRRQTVLPDRIIVVDNSTEDFKPAVTALIDDSIVFLGRDLPFGSLWRMRNIALEHAETDILAFLDDDGYASPGWIEAVLRTYALGDHVHGVTGRIEQGQPEQHIPGHPYRCGLLSPARGPYGNFNYVCDDIFEVAHAQGTNMTFRVSALRAAGGWDQNLSAAYGSFEDLSVCCGIRALGGKLYYNANAYVVHSLAPREAGVPRDIAMSSDFAAGSIQSFVYLMLKYNYYTPHSKLFFLNMIYGLKRCLLPATPNVPIRQRVASAIAVLRGGIRGTALFRRAVR